ncbi:hypothetical protein K2173_005545 [Erythroxylum novogranatense]|uniref:TITAN-like protein n=1 Tax=Erythroxylum novogranatense TaxID=1862640 RepID=A0AAV8SKY1_9ROSI|nr:hypothetical protein K2173_005545 [Erythroxylum novogranatense]
MNRKNKEKKKGGKFDYEFCKVCNLNHDQGQRHKYFPNHKKSLSAFLSRFQTKLADVRFFLNNPSVLRPEYASRNRLWCVFCDFELNELDSPFVCANAIHHLASVDHLKNVKHFLWKYGGGMDGLDSFRVTEADLSKWEKKCKSLKNGVATSTDRALRHQVGALNDIHIELNHENIDKFDKNDFDLHESKISNVVMPLQYNTNESQISHSGVSAINHVGPFIHDAVSSLPMGACPNPSSRSSNSFKGNWAGQVFFCDTGALSSYNYSEGMQQVSEDKRMLNGVGSSQDLLNISKVSSTTPGDFNGNVHTGALPPWFESTEENLLDMQLTQFSSSKAGKSHKLNPKRVGAAWAEKRKIELEMEKKGEITKHDFDTNWLPNFGRVWQSGSRKQSRKEFLEEKQKLPEVSSHSEMQMAVHPYISKRMEKQKLPEAASDSEMPIALQPYVSKRMWKDASK